jgi:pimeloyl-ACP methyl ester carboxylesterase
VRRHVLLIGGLLLVCLVCAGAGLIGQSIAAANDDRQYPPVGQLVDVGGRKIHLRCEGAGSPTVILEAASDATSASWGWVQSDLASTVRVCSYDRAGRGWSDPGPHPRDANAIVQDLHAALSAASVAPPYILVGHSAGGLYVRTYHAVYPGEVIGLVLVDAANPNEIEHNPAYPESLDSAARTVRALEWAARFGLLAATASWNEPGRTLPERERQAARAAWASPDLWQSVSAELAARELTDAQVRHAGSLGATPLVVLTGEQGASPAWLALQADLAKLSMSSVHLTAPADHVSLLHDPEDARTTADAVRRMIAATQRSLAQ